MSLGPGVQYALAERVSPAFSRFVGIASWFAHPRVVPDIRRFIAEFSSRNPSPTGE